MVPVEAAYQVFCVTRVLSMGIVYTDVQGVPETSTAKVLVSCSDLDLDHVMLLWLFMICYLELKYKHKHQAKKS